MTELTTPIRGSARRTGWRRLPILAGTGLLTGLLLTGGTLALWNADGAAPVAQIVAGDLDIDLVGETTWDETSQDVADPHTDLDPEGFMVRPGDTFTVTQDFTTTLQGDNMAAVLSVRWDDGDPGLHHSVTATYRVLEGDEELAGAAVGEEVRMDRVVFDNDSQRADLTLQVDLEFADDDHDRFGPEDADVIADLGTIVLGLDQVRTGEGFNE